MEQVFLVAVDGTDGGYPQAKGGLGGGVLLCYCRYSDNLGYISCNGNSGGYMSRDGHGLVGGSGGGGSALIIVDPPSSKEIRGNVDCLGGSSYTYVDAKSEKGQSGGYYAITPGNLSEDELILKNN